ncbi:unnamed protein product [Schistosoma bovis]|nr:unnamed protein product [Schistosoma bovis]
MQLSRSCFRQWTLFCLVLFEKILVVCRDNIEIIPKTVVDQWPAHFICDTTLVIRASLDMNFLSSSSDLKIC